MSGKSYSAHLDFSRMWPQVFISFFLCARILRQFLQAKIPCAMFKGYKQKHLYLCFCFNDQRKADSRRVCLPHVPAL